MIKNLLKVCASNAPKSPRVGRAVTPRTYATEANEYVYHISIGNIAGVDPSVIDECPVCSAILREMNGDPAPLEKEKESEIHVVGRIWLTPLILETMETRKFATF